MPDDGDRTTDVLDRAAALTAAALRVRGDYLTNSHGERCCLDCHHVIEHRLAHYPDAQRCIDCQSAFEKRRA